MAKGSRRSKAIGQRPVHPVPLGGEGSDFVQGGTSKTVHNKMSSDFGIIYSRFNLQHAMRRPPREVASDEKPLANTVLKTRPLSFDGPYYDSNLNVIAPHVDVDFYRERYLGNDDTRDAVVDYYETGWRLFRDPNGWFNTSFYLSTNDDVRIADCNPFWHYLVAGQFEGRRPTRPIDIRADILQELGTVRRRTGHPVPLPHQIRLSTKSLGSLLFSTLTADQGLVVSVSHDRYIDNVGGTQLVIGDEQQKFNNDRFSYFHISPTIARTYLPSVGDMPDLQIVLNGKFVGIASYRTIASALRGLPRTVPLIKLLVVHSILGHETSGLMEVAQALEPKKCFYWIHDFSSACESYNLLRNNIAYCAAPPADSMACRVCVHGDTRSPHTAKVRELFSTISFRVVAPSKVALDIWLETTDLPFMDASVHPHCQLREATYRSDREDAKIDAPARVAFVGLPIYRKGFHLLEQLLFRLSEDKSYHFFHFASEDTLVHLHGVTSVPISVTADAPQAMADCLREHDIDLVLMLAPWPETFSFVTYEAIAGGADVIALSVSGNVAVVLRQCARGVVLKDEESLYRFFESGLALAYVGRQRVKKKRYFSLDYTGTTATFRPGADSPTRQELTTADPGLRILVKGRRIHPLFVHDGIYRFELPSDCFKCDVVSRTFFRPRQKKEEHRRRLGIAVTSVKLDGTALAISDRRLREGWSDIEDGVRWTNGKASIVCRGTRILELSIRDVGRYIRTAHGLDTPPLRIASVSGRDTRRPSSSDSAGTAAVA